MAARVISIPAKDIKAGMAQPDSIRYMTDAAEQPDGSVSVVIQYPSSRREVIDFPDPDTKVEVFG